MKGLSPVLGMPWPFCLCYREGSEASKNNSRHSPDAFRAKRRRRCAPTLILHGRPSLVMCSLPDPFTRFSPSKCGVEAGENALHRRHERTVTRAAEKDAQRAVAECVHDQRAGITPFGERQLAAGDL